MAKPQRAFALIAALLLLASSLAVTGLTVWQMHENSKPADPYAGLPEEVKQQLKAQEALKNAQPDATKSSGGKLEGTKLANFTPVSDVTELKITDLKEGTGAVVPEGAKVVAHYTGALARTGVIFQSSHDSGSPIPFSLNGVIQGWTKGVPGMKVGGIRRLLIPANMAYGANGSPPSIGPNEPLVFDIEITSLGQ